MGDICRMNHWDRAVEVCQPKMTEWAEKYFLVTISGGIPEMYSRPSERCAEGVMIYDIDNASDNEPYADTPSQWYIDQWEEL